MAKILIVDNASFMRSSLKFIVENAGHSVVGMAENGGDAIKLYKELKPDIVLMDILMEGMDGIQALESVRKDDPNARVIMVTALGQENLQEKARGLGAAGYIRKPFKQEEIVKEIERVMK
jgi:two-component system chemotaxis response regulator CheY